MTDKISGSCLCAKVSFECDNHFEQFELCHCSQCQKTTGSAHAANLFTAANNITWLSGEDLLKRFDVPERAISTVFCRECGCSMPYLSKTGKTLVIPAGCLNGKADIEPGANIFCSEKASWYDKAISAKHYAKFVE